MAWVPCVRMAEEAEGSRFCARHARAIEGAVLGALMHAKAGNGVAGVCQEVPAGNLRKAKSRVGRGR